MKSGPLIASKESDRNANLKGLIIDEARKDSRDDEGHAVHLIKTLMRLGFISVRSQLHFLSNE